MKFYSFIVEGRPVPKARPRVARGHAYTPKRTKEYEEIVRIAYKNAGGTKLEGAVFMRIRAVYKAPKNSLLYHDRTKKPDLDNIAKAILDGLNGIAYEDDAQISFLQVKKVYGEEDFTIIEVSEAERCGLLLA